MPFPDEAEHLPVPANLLLSEIDIPFYTWPVCFLTFSLSFHTLESYHQASDCTENDNSQMFCQEVSSVLLSDRSGNDMLCSILFLSLGFNILTDYFYWSASICQQAKALTPKGFFPEFFPDFGIFLFQQSATGTFISIDKFTKFCSRLRTEHYMHMINVMVYYTIDRTIEQVFFFIFAQFISHLKRKENSCYIMLNVVLTDMG